MLRPAIELPTVGCFASVVLEARVGTVEWLTVEPDVERTGVEMLGELAQPTNKAQKAPANNKWLDLDIINLEVDKRDAKTVI